MGLVSVLKLNKDLRLNDSVSHILNAIGISRFHVNILMILVWLDLKIILNYKFPPQS